MFVCLSPSLWKPRMRSDLQFLAPVKPNNEVFTLNRQLSNPHRTLPHGCDAESLYFQLSMHAFCCCCCNNAFIRINS